MPEQKTVAVDHRQLGVDYFNGVWTLLEKERRTPAEDDELIHLVHASSYHWLQTPECKPENRARGEWICSRVYAVLGRGEPALYHGRRCLEHCEEHGIGDWDLAFAYEALARANLVAGDREAAEGWVGKAREAGEAIAEEDDREHFESELATLPN